MTQSTADRVWFRLMRLHTRAHTAISEKLRAIGLSVPQCDVISTLSEQEGITQQQLAQRLYVTKGNISGLIDRLAKAGLVERRQSRGDKRSHALYLTDAGKRMAAEGIAIQREFVARSVSGLDEAQLSQFEASIIALRDQIREMTKDGEGSRD